MLGKLESLGFTLQDEATLSALTMDVLKSSSIEGENLNGEEVRSSVARRLGLNTAGMVTPSRHVEGVVEMMMDATQRCHEMLTKERLCAWQAALFPTGRSGLYAVKTGDWRDGPMQVVSGAMGRERVHFEAPAASRLNDEMNLFLDWFNSDTSMEPVLKSGLAHLWFVTVHPFDDGNGRVARALGDILLARADGTTQRYYSLSSSIEADKRNYYLMLERTQKGSMDVTAWLLWYMETLDAALKESGELLKATLTRARFWSQHIQTQFNERQKKMVDALLDDFFGALNTSKWAKMTGCSTDTALRDIKDLVDKGVLVQLEAGGRSTGYALVVE
jgi:Fic family protein